MANLRAEELKKRMLPPMMDEAPAPEAAPVADFGAALDGAMAALEEALALAPEEKKAELSTILEALAKCGEYESEAPEGEAPEDEQV